MLEGWQHQMLRRRLKGRFHQAQSESLPNVASVLDGLHGQVHNSMDRNGGQTRKALDWHPYAFGMLGDAKRHCRSQVKPGTWQILVSSIDCFEARLHDQISRRLW
jgi:hypothetical protein